MTNELGVEKIYINADRLFIGGWLNNLTDENIIGVSQITFPFNSKIVHLFDKDPLKSDIRVIINNISFPVINYYVQDDNDNKSGYIQLNLDYNNEENVFGKRSTSEYFFSIKLLQKPPINFSLQREINNRINLSFTGRTETNDIIFMTYGVTELYKAKIEAPDMKPENIPETSIIRETIQQDTNKIDIIKNTLSDDQAFQLKQNKIYNPLSYFTDTTKKNSTQPAVPIKVSNKTDDLSTSSSNVTMYLIFIILLIIIFYFIMTLFKKKKSHVR